MVYFAFALLIIAGVFGFFEIHYLAMVVRAGMADRETVGLLGIGSNWAVWIFKVFIHNVIPAIALAVVGSAIFALAIGRALARSIKVLLLDEPYAGLAPVIVQEIAKTLDHIRNRRSERRGGA